MINHLQRFVEAGLQLHDYEITHLDSKRWPKWFIQLGGTSEKIKARLKAFHDARLSALESARLLLAIASVEFALPLERASGKFADLIVSVKHNIRSRRTYKAQLTLEQARPYFEAIKTKLGSVEEFFGLMKSTSPYLEEAKTFWNLNTPSAVASHFRQFWRQEWVMTFDVALSLINEPLLWAKSDGQEFHTFIGESKAADQEAKLIEEIKKNDETSRKLSKSLKDLLNKEKELIEQRKKALNNQTAAAPVVTSDEASGQEGRASEEPTIADYDKKLSAILEAIEKTTKDIAVIETALRSRQATLRFVQEEMAKMKQLSEAAQAMRFKGPAYEYRLDFSEEFQKFIVDSMKRSHTYPSSTLDEFKLFKALASRGATTYTDHELYRILHESDLQCVSCIEDTLTHNLVWDFEFRRHLFHRLNTSSPLHRARINRIQQESGQEREKSILDYINYVKNLFPEESPARADILEEFSATIESRFIETRIIHSNKTDSRGDLISSAFQLFTNLNTKLKTPSEKLEFIQFLQGKGTLPTAIRDMIQFGIGESRLIRQFQSFTPQLRGLLLEPIIGPPFGIMMNPLAKNDSESLDKDMSNRLMNLILEDAGDNRQDAEFLLNALLYALDKTEPHSKFSLIAFLLGQVGRVGGTPGDKLRVILDFMEGTGQSLAQALVQRRMLPQEYLDKISDLQDNGRAPHRLQVYKQLSELLGVVDPDDLLEFKNIAGAGSARIVLKIKLKSPELRRKLHDMGFGVAATEDGIVAMILLRPDMQRHTMREIQKMHYILEYLDQHATTKFKRLRGPIEMVQRNLLTQIDLSLEPTALPKMIELYEHNNGEFTGSDRFVFRVVRTDLSATPASQYAFAEYANGESLRRWSEGLTADQTRDVFSFIYEKEKSILFAEPDANGLIHFEDDRHKGNFKIDFSQNPVVISVFDYPLINTITVQRRSAILKLFGYLGKIKNERYRFIPPVIIAGMVQEFAHLLPEQNHSSDEKSPQLYFQENQTKLQQAFRQALDSFSLGTGENDRKPTHLLLDILAAADGVGIGVDSSIYSFLKAVGYADGYAPTPQDLENFLTVKITKMFAAEEGPSLGIADVCAMALSNTINTLTPGGRK